MEIQIFKGDSSAYVASGFNALSGAVGDEIEVCIMDFVGDEVLHVGGKRHIMHDGKVRIKASDLHTDEGCADIRLFSDDKLYVIEGLVIRDGVLKLDESTLQKYVCRIIIENHGLHKRIKKCEERIEKLESICSGNDFL